MSFECIGATGIKARIYRGVKVTIEGAVPGSPAEGRFKVGQVIARINGAELKGWFEPSFDDSKCQSGLAPIGKGPFERDRRSFESHGRELAPLPLDLYPCTGDGWRIRAQKKQQAASRKVPLKQERCMRNVWEQSRPRVEVDSL